MDTSSVLLPQQKQQSYAPWLYWILLGTIILFAFALRTYNVFIFNTYWADDGGGHIAYVDTIINKHRLPTMEETYLAWHEPLYYLGLSVWNFVGSRMPIASLNWLELSNVLIGTALVLVVWLLAYEVTKKNKWVALVVTSWCAFLFPFIKLSAYINNELLNQTLILGLAYLFIKHKLFARVPIYKIILWALLLGIALLVKLTAVIVLAVVFVMWFAQALLEKQYTYYLSLALLTILIVVGINIPWLIYKQRYIGTPFSINLYEKKPKQSVFSSDAWSYIGAWNWNLFIDKPYWYSLPHSYMGILIADTFGDYYNLFTPDETINELPPAHRILVQNGRFTTFDRLRSLLWANRIGLLMSIIWSIGCIGFLYGLLRTKSRDRYVLFVLLLLLAGWGALLYNNLRLPYVERGVLKVHFILYTIPLYLILTHLWWQKILRSPCVYVLFGLIPLVVYIIFAWRLLTVSL